MFIGRHFHSLDGKGRVAIPHKFRGELGGTNAGRVIVTVSPSERFAYLDAYPAAHWEKTIEQILDRTDNKNPPPPSKVFDFRLTRKLYKELSASGWQPAK